jgi:hypothetical protein
MPCTSRIDNVGTSKRFVHKHSTIATIFPQAICPHSRKLLWLQPSTVCLYRKFRVLHVFYGSGTGENCMPDITDIRCLFCFFLRDSLQGAFPPVNWSEVLRALLPEASVLIFQPHQLFVSVKWKGGLFWAFSATRTLVYMTIHDNSHPNAVAAQLVGALAIATTWTWT